MSIQFRSRIKSVFNYGNELKQVGKCCYNDGTSENLTFNQCFANGGYFLTDLNATCPSESTKGYCCSCSYLSASQRQLVVNNLPYSTGNSFFQDGSFGILPNITKCECDRIGGNWSETNSSYTLCQKDVENLGKIDTRIPNGCCSFIVQNGAPIGVTCQNVCTARDCANLVLVESGPDDPYRDTVFNENKVCGKEIVLNAPEAECSSGLVTSRLISANAAFAEDALGPCYTLDQTTLEYSCTISPSYLCSGYWVDPGEEGVLYCNSSSTPKSYTKNIDYLNPIQYTQQEFNQLGLSVGDEFQGGIYIGTFVPKKQNATNYSRVYGSLNFSTPSSTYLDVSSESSYKKWALIVNKSFFTARILSQSDPNYNFTSSYYDGYLNNYGDPASNYKITSKTLNTFAGKLRNGFIDYYVPSIIEMMFFAEQYRTNTVLSDNLDLRKTFVSTTFLTDKYLNQNPIGKDSFDDFRFFYGQDFTAGSNFGKVFASTIYTEVNFLLFRRIVIT